MGLWVVNDLTRYVDTIEPRFGCAAASYWHCPFVGAAFFNCTPLKPNRSGSEFSSFEVCWCSVLLCGCGCGCWNGRLSRDLWVIGNNDMHSVGGRGKVYLYGSAVSICVYLLIHYTFVICDVVFIDDTLFPSLPAFPIVIPTVTDGEAEIKAVVCCGW